MKRKALVTLVIAVTLLITTGCGLVTTLSTEQEAVSQAKAYVTKEVRGVGAEISNIEGSVTVSEQPSPAEKANGIQARMAVNIYFACRCPGGEWVNGGFRGRLQKKSGKWGTINVFVLDNPCTCGSPTPTRSYWGD